MQITLVTRIINLLLLLQRKSSERVSYIVRIYINHEHGTLNSLTRLAKPLITYITRIILIYS